MSVRGPAPSPLRSPQGRPIQRLQRRVAAATAAGFFFAISLMALAGADWPPPPRFGWFLMAFAVLAALLQQRLAVLLIRQHKGEGGGIAIAAREGALAGIGLGLWLLAIGGGEPSLPPSAGTTMLFLSAVGIAGALAAPVLWSIALLACRLHGQ